MRILCRCGVIASREAQGSSYIHSWRTGVWTIGFTIGTTPTHSLTGQQGSTLHKEQAGAFLISTTPASLALFTVTSSPAIFYLTENSKPMLQILVSPD
uniref:Uncharacterized protein n=1 Tax=Arundo donax TaxID=35708 RepID=A0A0A9D1F1_ARUDO